MNNSIATHNTEKIFTVEDKIIDPYEVTKIKVCGIILHLVIGLLGSLQGVPLTFFTFQMLRTQNVLTLDPKLVKPKCV